MKAKLWKRRPVEVLAMRVPGSGDRNIQERWEVAEWCGGETMGDSIRLARPDRFEAPVAHAGDWIIQEPFGRGDNQFQVVPGEVFETAYEEIG